MFFRLAFGNVEPRRWTNSCPLHRRKTIRLSARNLAPKLFRSTDFWVWHWPQLLQMQWMNAITGNWLKLSICFYYYVVGFLSWHSEQVWTYPAKYRFISSRAVSVVLVSRLFYKINSGKGRYRTRGLVSKKGWIFNIKSSNHRSDRLKVNGSKSFPTIREQRVARMGFSTPLI